MFQMSVLYKLKRNGHNSWSRHIDFLYKLLLLDVLKTTQYFCLKTIAATQPDIVMVELCASRVNLLSVDEETLLQEAKNLNMDKVRSAIRQVCWLGSLCLKWIV